MNTRAMATLCLVLTAVMCPLSGIADAEEHVRAPTRVFGFIAEGMVGGLYDGRVYDGDLYGSGVPALLYIDQDLLGGGHVLQVLFAGIYASVDVTRVRRPGFPVHIALHIDGLLVGMDQTFYRDGEAMEWTMRTPWKNLGVTLSREIGDVFSVSTSHSINLRNYKSESSNFNPPGNNVTYTGGGEVSLSTLTDGLPSAFARSEGYRFSVTSELIYQIDYQEWGPEEARYTHDGRPAYRMHYQARYHRDITPGVNLGGTASYLQGWNLYQLERWMVGQTDTFSPFPRLSGYYPGEFITSQSPLLNLDLLITGVPGRFVVSAGHDLFYHREEDRLYQGSTVGAAVTLIHGIEFGVRGGVGWDARRDRGPGWNAGLTLRYYRMNG